MEGVAGERGGAPVIARMEAGEAAIGDSEGLLGLFLPERIVAADVLVSDTASVVRAVTGVLTVLTVLETVLPGSFIATSLPIAGASASNAGEAVVLLIGFLVTAVMCLSALLAFETALGLLDASESASRLLAGASCFCALPTTSSAFVAPLSPSTALGELTGIAFGSSSIRGGFFLLSEI